MADVLITTHNLTGSPVLTKFLHSNSCIGEEGISAAGGLFSIRGHSLPGRLLLASGTSIPPLQLSIPVNGLLWSWLEGARTRSIPAGGKERSVKL